MRSISILGFALFLLFLQSCNTGNTGQANDQDETKKDSTEKPKINPSKKNPSKNSKNNANQSDQLNSTKNSTSSNTASDSRKMNTKIDDNNIDYNLLDRLLHNEINKVRRANNLPILTRHKVLKNAAADQNYYQIKNEGLTHTQTTRGKETLKDRVDYYGGGFQAMAENLIYEGFTVRTINGVKKEIITPTYIEIVKTMVKNWLESPGHRANIMEAGVDRVGTAIHYNPYNHAIYATQVFGKEW